MDHKTVFHLHLELSDFNGRSIGNPSSLRMAKARDGITRDILVPGETSLIGLHTIIQNAFGWGNKHLHKFSLNSQDFDYITERDPEMYEKLCGSLFRYCGPHSFVWCHHVLFGNPMYGLDPIDIGHTDAESLYVNHARTLRIPGINRCSIKSSRKAPSDGSLEQYANILLERLRIDELLEAEHERFYYFHNRRRLTAWRDEIIGKRSACLNEINLLRASCPYEYTGCSKALKELDGIRKSFLSYMAVRDDYEMVGRKFGCTPEEAFILHREKIIKCHDRASALISCHNPEISPVFDSINYLYDRGDQWRVHIRCLNIFHPVRSPAVSVGCGMPLLRDSSADNMSAGSCGFLTSDCVNNCYSAEGPAHSIWTDDTGVNVLPHTAKTLSRISDEKFPICIAADGLNVMDDIGGMRGYFDFLKAINGSDRREAMRLKEIADIYGWNDYVPQTEEVEL